MFSTRPAIVPDLCVCVGICIPHSKMECLGVAMPDNQGKKQGNNPCHDGEGVTAWEVV